MRRLLLSGFPLVLTTRYFGIDLRTLTTNQADARPIRRKKYGVARWPIFIRYHRKLFSADEQKPGKLGATFRGSNGVADLSELLRICA